MKSEISEAEWWKLAVASERCGISRPELFRAIVRGDIIGSHIKKPGLSKGVWLVNRLSLDTYIRSFLPGGSRFGGAMPPPAPTNRRQKQPAKAK
jgi:hypothetical protein